LRSSAACRQEPRQGQLDERRKRARGRRPALLGPNEGPEEAGARSLRLLGEVCVTVTLVDGLVLARSAFHHSINYRSVMVFGSAREVVEEDEKLLASRAIVEHVCRGRWEDVRKPSPRELRSTLLLAIPLSEASAKIRTGPPRDREEDVHLRTWAGELPLRTVTLDPLDAQDLPPGVTVPDYVRTYRRRNDAIPPRGGERRAY
jgi:hypothetical protein